MLVYNDSGCNITDESVAIYNLILGVQSLRDELSDQINFNNLFAREKLKGSVRVRYLRTLSSIERNVLELAPGIVTPFNSYPRIFRSNCPTENQCEVSSYATTSRLMLAKVSKLEGYALKIHQRGLKSLIVKKVAAKNTQYLRKIRGIASEVRKAIRKLPMENNICPRL